MLLAPQTSGGTANSCPFEKQRTLLVWAKFKRRLFPFRGCNPDLAQLLVKDEGRLPTGSFKARGLCLAVSMAKELGIQKVAMPTNGNAGAALAAYATRAEIETYVFCPDDTPEINVREIAAQGPTCGV